MFYMMETRDTNEKWNEKDRRFVVHGVARTDQVPN
jgi:hypothetical protein